MTKILISMHYKKRASFITDQIEKKKIDQTFFENLFRCMTMRTDTFATLEAIEEGVEEGKITESQYLIHTALLKLIHELKEENAERHTMHRD